MILFLVDPKDGLTYNDLYLRNPMKTRCMFCFWKRLLAKLSGSYAKLSGGYTVLAWMVLTGCEDLQIWGKDKLNNMWTKCVPALNKCKNDPWNFQKMWVYSTKMKKGTDEMFEYLKFCDVSNYVMGASINGDVMEKARSDGLIERHAYSLLQVFEDKSQNIKLVQLRNPWGNGHESLLDWCDSSDKWKQHPDVAEKVHWSSDDDGLFWMCWKDFVRVFDSVEIAAKTMDIRRGMF